jgi:hypothetical protein
MFRTFPFHLVVLLAMVAPATQLLGREGRTVCQQEVSGGGLNTPTSAR